MRRRIIALAALLAATGCGADPYADHPKEHGTRPPAGEQPASRLPKRSGSVPSDALAATPEQAARRAAKLTTSWTGETAALRYAELARTSIGAARRDARETAARLPTDPQLSAPGARSTGTVEAVATRTATARERQLVVVTNETLTADGLHDRRWRVTLATVERRDGGWVLSRWEPQP